MKTDMIGPGGKDGCSKIGCTNRAVVTQVYTVKHPHQEEYDVQYKWCDEHDHELSKHYYPNFRRIS